MKKILTILAIVSGISLGTVTASAEGFGFKGGVNISSMNVEGIKNYLGYQAGLSWQVDLPLWLSVQPDLLFHVKGGRIEDFDMNAFGLGYLEIPVNIQWGPRFAEGKSRVFAQFSPYIGYAISKDIKDKSGASYAWNNINRFEYGVGAGIGVQFGVLQLTGQYNWSLGKLANSDIANESFNSIFSDSNFSGYTISLALLF